MSAADTKPPPSSAVSFFSRLGLFWRFGTFGFCRTRRRTDGRTDETGLPPDPLLRTENRQIFIANFFFKKHFGANFFKIAKKKFGDKILAIFCSWNGGLGVARFPVSGFVRVRPSVRPSVLSGKTRVFRIAKKGQVAKKNETADDGGGSVSPRPTARYPNPRPRPTPPTAKYGIAKNGELLGPKVKGRMRYSKANI